MVVGSAVQCALYYCVLLFLSIYLGLPWIKFALPAFAEQFMLKFSLILYSLRFAEQSVSFFSFNLTVVIKNYICRPYVSFH